ncbi:MAG TPA: hypothetical protein DCO75_10195 [Fibrobacteres bacterium]|jgi:hypothetical protein|nr:hypothetical protein [Fibrobacterota bacterium]
MAKIELHPDFKDFLRLLHSHNVKYLLVGGYAVAYHGYPRATGDMDIWIAMDAVNAEKTVEVLRDFGMHQEEVSPELFLEKDRIIRMGFPPVRIEVITGVSGVDFYDCYTKRTTVVIDEISIDFISLDDLKKNKEASGRYKDLEDLRHLP